jgi:hypothetical protein
MAALIKTTPRLDIPNGVDGELVGGIHRVVEGPQEARLPPSVTAVDHR